MEYARWILCWANGFGRCGPVVGIIRFEMSPLKHIVVSCLFQFGEFPSMADNPIQDKRPLVSVGFLYLDGYISLARIDNNGYHLPPRSSSAGITSHPALLMRVPPPSLEESASVTIIHDLHCFSDTFKLKRMVEAQSFLEISDNETFGNIHQTSAPPQSPCWYEEQGSTTQITFQQRLV